MTTEFAFAVVGGLLAICSLAGACYQLIAAQAVRRFGAGTEQSPQARPPVSVLKPLCGEEPGLQANLQSFCRQDYPCVQVVFGTADAADPALRLVERANREAPGADTQVVVDPELRGCNRKVSNLINMVRYAKHDLLVIADSDVRVGPGYLDHVVAAFSDPTVGVVTCLYVGRPIGGLWSRLAAMGINHDFIPSALVARELGRCDGCFGPTMALSREMLEAIGGLEPLKDMLADDWGLGAAVRRRGKRIGLAARPVDVMVHDATLGAMLLHEIRWGRTIAAIDRPSYMASVITHPVALASLAALVEGGSWPSLGLWIFAALCRLRAVRIEEQALSVGRSAWGIILLRDALGFVVFLAACAGRTVEWRGRRFRIRKDGTLDLA